MDMRIGIADKVTLIKVISQALDINRPFKLGKRSVMTSTNGCRLAFHNLWMESGTPKYLQGKLAGMGRYVEPSGLARACNESE
jgi:hypothetical protein